MRDDKHFDELISRRFDDGSPMLLAVKIDDGDTRGLHPLVIALCERFGFLDSAQVHALEAWRSARLRNWAGVEVGGIEVLE